MILDAETFDQVAAVDRILRGVEGLDLPGLVEDRAVRVGLRDEHGICANAGEVDAALPVLRRAAAAAAAREGLAIAAAASHPFAQAGGAADRQGGALRHVRRPTAASRCGARAFRACTCTSACRRRDDCWRVPRGDPAVAAGRARALRELAVVRRRADRDGVEPRAGARRAAPCGRAAGVRAPTRSGSRGSSGSSRSASPQDYTRIWWDVRPHPKLGTLEVRIPDQPTDVRCSAAFAALLQALCATALEGGLPGNGSVLGDRGRADYAQNRWAAARFGPRAKLLHPDGSSCVAGGRARRRAARARPAGGARARRRGMPRPDRPADCEADLQLERRRPRLRRGSRRPLASLSAWPPSPRRSRSAASAASGA